MFTTIDQAMVWIRRCLPAQWGCSVYRGSGHNDDCIMITSPDHFGQLDLWCQRLKGDNVRTAPLFYEGNYGFTARLMLHQDYWG